MSNRTLLERLEYPERPTEREREDSSEVLLASIRRNIERLLNAHKGFAPSAPDFGLSDLVEISFAGTKISRLEDELRQSIQRFEPRLTQVGVRFIPAIDARLSLRFDVHGVVSVGGEARSARFHTTVEASGQMLVRES